MSATGKDNAGEGRIRDARGVAGRRTRYLLVAFAAIAAALMVAVSTLALVSAYRRAIAEAEQQTANLARAFGMHAFRSIGETMRMIYALDRQLTSPHLNPPEFELYELLHEQVMPASQIQAVVVLDRNGQVVASSLAYPTPKVDLSSRSYYRRHRDEASAEILITGPLRSKLAPRDLLAVSKRLTDPAGTFSGVLVASLSPTFFSEFYGSVRLDPGAAIELVNDSGTIIARSPQAPDGIEGESTVWDAVRSVTGPQVGLRHSRAGDGERIVAVQRLAPYPLSVNVSASLGDVLRPWRIQLYQQGSATALAVLALFALTWLLLRQYGQLSASEASERHYAELLEQTISSMVEGVIAADRDGRPFLINPAAQKIFGQPLTVFSNDWGRTHHRFHADGVTPLTSEESPLARAIRGEKTDNFEQVITSPERPEGVHLLTNGRPLRDRDGSLAGGVVVLRDVTEARETERQLRQAQKMDAIGRLTGGIAHDFNNILTVILGTIEALAEGVADRPKLAAIAQMIDQAAERGAELTQHLLAFARKQPLQPCTVDVNALIRDSEKLLKTAAGEPIKLHFACDAALPPALVDPSQLTTAILNLVINARDAMPGGGQVTIETRGVYFKGDDAGPGTELPPGGYVMVAVTDTGVGMAPQVRERVFEPFFTTKGTGQGTGLGLSMVYGFVKQSGGKVEIYSEEGHGTVVRLYLPRADQAPDQSDEDRADEAEGGNERILMVEDDPLVRNSLLERLTVLGYRVTATADAAEALTAIDKGDAFDLLMTDVILPGAMSGPDLAQAVAQRRPQMRVLYTSGFTENAILREGRLAPGVLLLAKPYRVGELARMVRLALRRPPPAADA